MVLNASMPGRRRGDTSSLYVLPFLSLLGQATARTHLHIKLTARVIPTANMWSKFLLLSLTLITGLVADGVVVDARDESVGIRGSPLGPEELLFERDSLGGVGPLKGKRNYQSTCQPPVTRIVQLGQKVLTLYSSNFLVHI